MCVTAPRAGALVQVVDVLRAQEQRAAALGETCLEPGQSGVSGVGNGGQEVAAAQVVERMHGVGRAGERFRGRELHRMEAAPQWQAIRSRAPFSSWSSANPARWISPTCSAGKGRNVIDRIEGLVDRRDEHVGDVEQEFAAGGADDLAQEVGLFHIGLRGGDVAGRVLQQHADTQDLLDRVDMIADGGSGSRGCREPAAGR